MLNRVTNRPKEGDEEEAMIEKVDGCHVDSHCMTYCSNLVNVRGSRSCRRSFCGFSAKIMYQPIPT